MGRREGALSVPAPQPTVLQQPLPGLLTPHPDSPGAPPAYAGQQGMHLISPFYGPEPTWPGAYPAPGAYGGTSYSTYGMHMQPYGMHPGMAPSYGGYGMQPVYYPHHQGSFMGPHGSMMQRTHSSSVSTHSGMHPSSSETTFSRHASSMSASDRELLRALRQKDGKSERAAAKAAQVVKSKSAKDVKAAAMTNAKSKEDLNEADMFTKNKGATCIVLGRRSDLLGALDGPCSTMRPTGGAITQSNRLSLPGCHQNAGTTTTVKKRHRPHVRLTRHGEMCRRGAVQQPV